MGTYICFDLSFDYLCESNRECIRHFRAHWYKLISKLSKHKFGFIGKATHPAFAKHVVRFYWTRRRSSILSLVLDRDSRRE